MNSLPLYRKSKRRRNYGPEASLQYAIVEWLRIAGVPNMIFLHPCNEAKRSPATANHLKRMGMCVGAADLIINVSSKPSLALELKARGEKQSVEQIAFEQGWRDSGGHYVCIDNIDDALDFLYSWGALRYQRTQRKVAA